MVSQLTADGRLRSPPLAAAFATVPRHLFLPGVPLPTVYATDEAVPTKFGADGTAISSSSAPAIMAIMLERLAVHPGDHVLEIGAGTGYQAAILAKLVGPGGAVTI